MSKVVIEGMACQHGSHALVTTFLSVKEAINEFTQRGECQQMLGKCSARFGSTVGRKIIICASMSFHCLFFIENANSDGFNQFFMDITIF